MQSQEDKSDSTQPSKGKQGSLSPTAEWAMRALDEASRRWRQKHGEEQEE